MPFATVYFRQPRSVPARLTDFKSQGLCTIPSAVSPTVVDFSAGTKFGPPENAYKLVSQGGPYSSIKGTRTTDVKAGTPPSPPVFKFSYKPGRTDTPAPKSPAKKDGDDDRRKLLQSKLLPTWQPAAVPPLRQHCLRRGSSDYALAS